MNCYACQIEAGGRRQTHAFWHLCHLLCTYQSESQRWPVWPKDSDDLLCTCQRESWGTDSRILTMFESLVMHISKWILGDMMTQWFWRLVSIVMHLSRGIPRGPSGWPNDSDGEKVCQNPLSAIGCHYQNPLPKYIFLPFVMSEWCLKKLLLSESPVCSDGPLSYTPHL